MFVELNRYAFLKMITCNNRNKIFISRRLEDKFENFTQKI